VETGRSRAGVYLACAALLGAITWLDIATGYELGLFALYLIPVSLAAWRGRRRAGVLFALAAGACWLISDRVTLHPYSSPGMGYWEAAMRLASYLTVALLLSRVRSGLRDREDLLHVVSHDLRSPLAVVVGQAQLLRRQAAGQADLAPRVEAILRAASRIDAMVEDLLDSARDESRRLQVEARPIDLRHWLPELLGRSASALEVERVRLALPGEEGPAVLADPSRLERVVVNLLSNALKYSPPGSPVELRAGRQGAKVTLSVTDHGEGIPPGERPHVFDRFYRGEGTAARGGLGIGLYSVKLLVAAHGGRVWFEPGEPCGTTFHVELPAASAGEPAPPA
jgi:signal transduction histidine kinase